MIKAHKLFSPLFFILRFAVREVPAKTFFRFGCMQVLLNSIF